MKILWICLANGRHIKGSDRGLYGISCPDKHTICPSTGTLALLVLLALRGQFTDSMGTNSYVIVIENGTYCEFFSVNVSQC